MGRIQASITISNLNHPETSFRCDALVDTGAPHLTLPMAWRERLGELREMRTVELETATQDKVHGIICAPVCAQIEGFDPVSVEALFVDMNPEDGRYEPLIGHLVLEPSQAAVDMLGHRLLHVKYLDLK